MEIFPAASFPEICTETLPSGMDVKLKRYFQTLLLQLLFPFIGLVISTVVSFSQFPEISNAVYPLLVIVLLVGEMIVGEIGAIVSILKFQRRWERIFPSASFC